MKTTKEVWNSMPPEERAKCPTLRYLNRELLQKSWDELPQFTKDHIILLLVGHKEDKGGRK